MSTIFANDQTANDGHDARGPEQLDADVALPQQAHHVRVHGVQGACPEPGAEGKESMPVMRPCAVCVMHLPLQAESLADHMRGLVQHLGQVAAALLLDQDGGGHDSQVLQGNPREQVVHGGLQLQAVVLLVKADANFAAHRVGALAGHQAHGGDQAVSGAQRAHHQVERFGQFLLEGLEALGRA